MRISPVIALAPAGLASATLLVLAFVGVPAIDGASMTTQNITLLSGQLKNIQFWLSLLALVSLVALLVSAAILQRQSTSAKQYLKKLAERAFLATKQSLPESKGNNNDKQTAAISYIIAEYERLHLLSEHKDEEIKALHQTLKDEQALTIDASKRGEESRCNSLKTASHTLGNAIEDIGKLVGTLRDATQSASQGATQQRQLASESATAMEEMNASVSQVAENAEAAATAATQAMEEAGKGAQSVAETVEAIQGVEAQTSELRVIVQGLGSQADGIGQIMTVIADIADQTNLLALNAAIEAARAGDAGRGFAVVADEVRKLAEKTMDATRDVGNQIKAIQGGVTETTQGMDNAADMVEKATDVAKRSGGMLTQIVALSRENQDQIQSIAAAATEQSAASEQVTRAVTEVDAISRQTDETLEQSDKAMDDLLTNIDSLAGLNNAFKLIGSGSVQDLLGKLIHSEEITSMDPARQEKALREVIRDNTHVELLYLTDAQGVQHIANIPRPGSESAEDESAKGKNWSDRPWFTQALLAKGFSISDVYQSSASGQPCITVSVPVFDDKRIPMGILAADVTVD